MKKYWAFCLIEWQQTFAYRGESLVWFLLELLPMVYLINLWISLDRSGLMSPEKVGSLIVYQFLALAISRLTSSHFEERIIDQIKDGTISKDFLKPFSLKGYLFVQTLTWRVSGFLYVLPTLFLLVPVWGFVSKVVIQTNQIWYVTVILCFAFLQRFLLSYLITLTAYWFTEAKFIVHLKWMLEGMLGGAWIPIYFYPIWFQKIGSWSPFYYFYTVPINGLMSKIQFSTQIQQIFIAVLWIIGLWILVKKFERKAMIRFSSVGG